MKILIAILILFSLSCAKKDSVNPLISNPNDQTKQDFYTQDLTDEEKTVISQLSPEKVNELGDKLNAESVTSENCSIRYTPISVKLPAKSKHAYLKTVNGWINMLDENKISYKTIYWTGDHADSSHVMKFCNTEKYSEAELTKMSIVEFKDCESLEIQPHEDGSYEFLINGLKNDRVLSTAADKFIKKSANKKFLSELNFRKYKGEKKNVTAVG